MNQEGGGREGIPRHEICVQINHPTLLPDEITEVLEWDPEVAYVVGEVRRYPNGTLRGGIWPSSYWCGSEEDEGSSVFRAHLLEIISCFEARPDFFRDLVRTGGTIWVTVRLPGDASVGDTLEPEDLEAMARLGIEFGVEVFPHMP